MKALLILSLIVLANFTALAQEGKTTQLPADELKLRTELESDTSFLQMACGLRTAIDMKHPYAEQGLKSQKENSRIRRLIYSASLTNDKTLKTKQKCPTDEGDTIMFYLIVENGKVKYVEDYSRDPFGGLRVHSWDCNKLSIGHFVQNENKELAFVELVEKDLDGKILVLECRTDNRTFIF